MGHTLFRFWECKVARDVQVNAVVVCEDAGALAERTAAAIVEVGGAAINARGLPERIIRPVVFLPLLTVLLNLFFGFYRR